MQSDKTFCRAYGSIWAIRVGKFNTEGETMKIGTKITCILTGAVFISLGAASIIACALTPENAAMKSIMAGITLVLRFCALSSVTLQLKTESADRLRN